MKWNGTKGRQLYIITGKVDVGLLGRSSQSSRKERRKLKTLEVGI